MTFRLLVLCSCVVLNSCLLLNGPASVCEDKIDNCRYYQGEICTAQEFRPWTLEHCALFCGLCKPGVTVPYDCTDKVTCRFYDDGNLCKDQRYRFWLEDNCRTYCHLNGCP